MILPREHPDYEVNEPYYLFNFCLLEPEKQWEHFYLKEFAPVPGQLHEEVVCLDVSYNHRIVNPVYQLFVAGFHPARWFMNFIDAMTLPEDDFEGWGDVEGLLLDAFPDSWLDRFFDDLAFNTSRDGFLKGAYWCDLRARCRRFLQSIDMIEELEFPKPMKFYGFLYPDDFLEYKKIPYWSRYGQVVSMEEWSEVKARVEEDYRNAGV